MHAAHRTRPSRAGGGPRSRCPLALAAPALVAAASLLPLSATALAATHNVVQSLTFAHVPKGYHLAAVAWEDTSDPSMSMTVLAPAGLSIVTEAQARQEALLGPAVLPNGRTWFLGTPGDLLGTHGQIVFEFRGPHGQILCAASPLVTLPSKGTWAAVNLPVQVSATGVVDLPRYTWIQSLDGQWTHAAAALDVYTTPNASGYNFVFRNLPLDWQLLSLRFATGHVTLSATVAQALGQDGGSMYFSAGSANWSFNYPAKDAGLHGRLGASFNNGAGHTLWIESNPLTLRG
jgi:hypothetical protein